MNCSGCHKPLIKDKRRKGTKCARCWQAERSAAVADQKKQRYCSECGDPLPIEGNARRKGALCKPCSARAAAKSPEHREAVSRVMTRRWNDPKERARLMKAIKIGSNRPEVIEMRRRLGRMNQNCTAAAAGSEARKKAGRTLSKRKLGWLPDHYRPEYFKLRINHKYSAAEARLFIEDQMERDLDRIEARGLLAPPHLAELQHKRDLARRRERHFEGEPT